MTTDNPAPTDRPDAAAPWTLPELANGLETVSARLDQAEDAFGVALDKVSTVVLQMREQLNTLLQKKADQDIEPRPWTVRATPAQWDELIDWVDWVQEQYGATPGFNIHPCWPAHPGVVEELAGVHHAWRRAQINDQVETRNGSNDLIGWHDRWLWPLLARLEKGHYRITGCSGGHEPERRTSKPTDRSHLPSQNLPTHGLSG